MTSIRFSEHYNREIGVHLLPVSLVNLCYTLVKEEAERNHRKLRGEILPNTVLHVSSGLFLFILRYFAPVRQSFSRSLVLSKR